MKFLIEKADSNILYHATYKQFLPSIKAKGLGNTSKKMYSDSKGKGIVYFAVDPDEAESYAEENDWLDTVEDPDKYIDNIIILAINKNDLDKSKLFKDENVQDGTTTFEYHGIIPFDKVRIYR